MVYPEGKQSFQRGRMALCGISTVVVRLLPKQEARVRFSYPAHFFAPDGASKCRHLFSFIYNFYVKIFMALMVFVKKCPL